MKQIYIIRGSELEKYTAVYDFKNTLGALMSMINIAGMEQSIYQKSGKKASMDCVTYGIDGTEYIVVRLMDAKDKFIYRLAVEK
jgi:hypothetical protein